MRYSLYYYLEVQTRDQMHADAVMGYPSELFVVERLLFTGRPTGRNVNLDFRKLNEFATTVEAVMSDYRLLLCA